MNNTIFCSPRQEGGSIQKAYNRVTNQEIGYTSSSNTVRKKHKDKKIIGMSINRTPITISNTVLNTVGISLKDKAYDDLYHLYMLVTFRTNTYFAYNSLFAIDSSTTCFRLCTTLKPLLEIALSTS